MRPPVMEKPTWRSRSKIVFSRSRDIPFDKLVISEANVRQIRPETGLDELTQDIDRREDLIQGLNVRALLDENGEETGRFEVPAGGRRYRAIERLVKAKRFPKDGLVPCVVRKSDTNILKEDNSLAETCSALGCIHSISFARSRAWSTKRCRGPRSHPHISQPNGSSNSGCASRAFLPSCSTSMQMGE